MPSSFLISTIIVDIHQINDNISWTNGHCLLLLLSLIGLNINGSLLRGKLKKVREGVLIREISDPFTIFLSPFEFKQWQNLSFWVYISSIFSYFSSVTQACLTLCDPMNWGSRLPVHHQLLELAQTHVHQVSDAIQPAHPLLSPSPPAPNPSQHQSLFQWVSSSHEVDKVLEFQL